MKAFTIIEILIAISVMAIGIVGIYAIVPRTISWGAINIDKFIASQLSREGLELVRNIRDANWLQGESWNNGLAVGAYEIDYNDPGLASFQNRFLKIDEDGFYDYEGSLTTKFKREITIATTTSPEPEGIKVKSKVDWLNKNFTLEENLYDWKQ